MGILWEKFEDLEYWLKKCRPLGNECIERLAILLNLDSLMTEEQLEERIRKVGAFNEYLAFRQVRESCHQDLGLIIKNPQELKEKIENPKYSEYDRYGLNELHQIYEKLAGSPQNMKWDIGPCFNTLGEHYGMFEHKRIGKDCYFQKSPKAQKIIFDLIQGFRSQGILEFYIDKDELFKPRR